MDANTAALHSSFATANPDGVASPNAINALLPRHRAARQFFSTRAQHAYNRVGQETNDQEFVMKTASVLAVAGVPSTRRDALLHQDRQ